jgi:hypothetical protein
MWKSDVAVNSANLMATYLLVGLLMLDRFVMRCLVLQVGGLRHRVGGPILIKKKNLLLEPSDYVNCVEPMETT